MPTATSGRGVSLAALRQAVRDLGGRIDISTEPGRGTTAVFTFVATPSVVAQPVPHLAHSSRLRAATPPRP